MSSSFQPKDYNPRDSPKLQAPTTLALVRDTESEQMWQRSYQSKSKISWAIACFCVFPCCLLLLQVCAFWEVITSLTYFWFCMRPWGINSLIIHTNPLLTWPIHCLFTFKAVVIWGSHVTTAFFCKSLELELSIRFLLIAYLIYKKSKVIFENI